MPSLLRLFVLLLAALLAACTGSASVEAVAESTVEAVLEPAVEPTATPVPVDRPERHLEAPDVGPVGDACAAIDGASPHVDHEGQQYCLGAPLLTADDVESAGVLDQNGFGSVEIVLTSEGLAKFNLIAPDCVELTALCPTGQVAIVVDGYVESAPLVQSPKFDEPKLVVSGNSPLDEAAWIAQQLQAGVGTDFLVFRVVLSDLGS